MDVVLDQANDRVVQNKVVLGQRLNIYPALILIRDGNWPHPEAVGCV
jgi:hypothetical protein